MQKIKPFIATVFLLIMSSALGYFWINFRRQDLNTNDLFAIFLGIAGFFWMIFWLSTKYASRYSLLVPYAPIFIVIGSGLLLSHFGIVSGYDTMNLVIFFYSGYMCSFSVHNLYNLLFKSKLK